MNAAEKRDIVVELEKRLKEGIKVEGKYPETYYQNIFGYPIQQTFGSREVYLWLISNMKESEEGIYMSILKVTKDVNDGQKEIDCQSLKGKKVKLISLGNKPILTPYFEISGMIQMSQS